MKYEEGRLYQLEKLQNPEGLGTCMLDPREQLWEQTVASKHIEYTSLKFVQKLIYLQHSVFYLPPEGLPSLRTKLNLSQFGCLVV